MKKIKEIKVHYSPSSSFVVAIFCHRRQRLHSKRNERKSTLTHSREGFVCSSAQKAILYSARTDIQLKYHVCVYFILQVFFVRFFDIKCAMC
jgi:hypothetical protein